MHRSRLNTPLALCTLCYLLAGCGTAVSGTDTTSTPSTDSAEPAGDAVEDAGFTSTRPSTDSADGQESIEADAAPDTATEEPLDDTTGQDTLADTATEEPLDDTTSQDTLADTGAEEPPDTTTDISTTSDAADTGDLDTSTCNTAVLEFSQDNPQQFEFYELCVDTTGASEATLQAIDATLYCGVSGVFAGCKSANELGCHGDLVYAAPGSKEISGAGWETLCALSAADGVRIIAGGYWL